MDSVKENHERVAKTICAMCHNRCRIEAHLKGNILKKIVPDHEGARQRLCIKSQAISDFEYSNQRLRNPLRRVNGNFKRISWDEALDFITTKLNHIKDKYGPESLALYYGNGVTIQQAMGLLRLWAQAFGTPNFCDIGCVCYWSKKIAERVTFGWDERPSLGDTKCVFNWGFNSYHSLPPARRIWANMKNQGTRLIVIDPRITHEAKMADLHLRPRVGTDWALALGFLNVIIAKGLYDKAFVNQWTIGFDNLARAIADDYTPEKVADITEVPAHMIRAAAEIYATTKPATMISGHPVDVTTHGFQLNRARSILTAITGNLDIEGGNLINPPGISRLLRFARDDYEYLKAHKPTFTADRYPLCEEMFHQPVGTLLTETIITKKPHPIKGLICQGGNPCNAYPDVTRFKHALKELDLVLVMDVFMTEMAEQADLVLPAATFLERDWATNLPGSNIHAGVGIVRKVLEPIGECWSDSRFWLELAKRMGYHKAFPWQNEREVLEEICRAAGGSFEEMSGRAQGLPEPMVFKSYQGDKTGKRGFPTPSGKVEIYSERLKKLGISPLPVPYEESYESPVTQPEIFNEYPLTGLSGIRSEVYTNAQGHNLPTLRSRYPDPLFEINPKDARRYGVSNGDWNIIESPKGKVKMKACISENIREGTISIPQWGGESNANLLTSADKPGPVIGTVNMMGFACRVRKNQYDIQFQYTQ